MYGPPGRAYVYLNYGIHELVNAVTEAEGRPAAILIRAVAPLEGLEVMRERRRGRRGRSGRPMADDDLCRGPGNLTVAMAVDRMLNESDLVGGPLRIEDRGMTPPAVDHSPRIGIRVGGDRLWRLSWRRHPAVSGPRPAY